MLAPPKGTNVTVCISALGHLLRLCPIFTIPLLMRVQCSAFPAKPNGFRRFEGRIYLLFHNALVYPYDFTSSFEEVVL